MLESDDNTTATPDAPAAPARAPRKRAARKTAAAVEETAAPASAGTTEAEAPRKRAPRKATAKKASAKKTPAAPAGTDSVEAAAPRKRAPRKTAPQAADSPSADASEPAAAAPAKKPARKRAAKKAAPQPAGQPNVEPVTEAAAEASPAPAPEQTAKPARKRASRKRAAAAAPSEAESAGSEAAGEPSSAAQLLFLAPSEETAEQQVAETEADGEAVAADPEEVRDAAIEQATGARRRRRRGRRGRGGRTGDGADDTTDSGGDAAEAQDVAPEPAAAPESESGTSTSRKRRRRRAGAASEDTDADPNTVVHVREPKRDDDGVRGVKGSTRLEAKRQRRRDGRETTRRRAPILSESEFLARREAVERAMVVRQNGDRTQIAVLEDGMLVEHYVTRASATSYVGNIYLGRVQNVLPSMEAAFIDIGKGRNGVLYAGEVNWDAAGLEGKSRAIENALRSGDSVLVQVTKDPIGHKGARLTSQISLPGRFLVYVPGGGMTGISRRLPDTERHRLKSILKKIVPEDGGVIVRTAAEGASEEELTHDVERLTAQWREIEQAAQRTSAAPTLLHGEPDLAIRVVRDVFNEDFKYLQVQGDDAWATVYGYVEGVAPELVERLSHHTGDTDLFHALRIDEQLMKALDRKVWLPSGGSLVIDRTEAMTVIDVNTGKFVGSGGNLEETVTRNNLEAAEEIVRQLRLRDVGGIVVIDFIDMVLESNRDLVLRRLTECLGRDRTKHQVAEVTSLGLVQMTRKRVGEGLLEAFSEPCTVCNGRGVIVHTEPIDQPGESTDDDDRPRGKQGKRRRGNRSGDSNDAPQPVATQRQAASAAMAAIHRATHTSEGEGDESDVAPDTEIVEVTLAEEAPELTADLPDRDAAAPETDTVEAPAATDAGDATAAIQTTDAAAASDEVIASVAVTEAPGAPAPEATPEPATPVADAQTPPAPKRRRRVASRPAGPPEAS